MSKPRSDSTLKNLPTERQEQIIEWCAKGYAHAQEQLAADGIKTSIRALSEFFNWYSLEQDFSSAESFAQQVEASLKKQFPEATAEKLSAAGQLAFTAMATAKRDPEEFRAMEDLRLRKETAATKGRQKDEELKLAERRVAVMENKIKQATKQLNKIVEKGGLSAAALKEIERAAKILQ